MGFWQKLFGTQGAAPAILSPWAPADSMATFAATEILGDISAAGGMTREIALRTPGVKRAHGIHCSLVAAIPLHQMDGDVRAKVQPGWLTNSASGISPYHRLYGVVSDLFMHGWACIGFTADKTDALHVPYGLWGLDEAGVVRADPSIPAIYHDVLVAIQLGYGENGILVDGLDTLRASRNIERVWMERVENPAPATNLHINDPAFNGMTRKEKRRQVDDWNENRRRGGGQTALTPSYLDVIALGETSADLFEKGRNAVRLDIANHSAVPASIIEGAKEAGGSDLTYSNATSSRSELFDFGTRKFLNAIEARLSLDDVSPSGQSIRGDLSGFVIVPTPTTNPTSED